MEREEVQRDWNEGKAAGVVADVWEEATCFPKWALTLWRNAVWIVDE